MAYMSCTPAMLRCVAFPFLQAYDCLRTMYKGDRRCWQTRYSATTVRFSMRVAPGKAGDDPLFSSTFQGRRAAYVFAHRGDCHLAVVGAVLRACDHSQQGAGGVRVCPVRALD